MSRQFYGVEKGLDVYAENGDLQARLLTSTAAPVGTGDQDTAPIGSVLLRTDDGSFYQKKTDTTSAGDWVLNGSSTATIGNWRPERVDANTGQVLIAGATNPTTWSDNDDGTTFSSFTIGNYVLDGNCALWEITAIATPNITLVAASTAPATDDMFAVKFNMPDPAGQENQAIIVFDGTSCIKVADVDFAVATGIVLSAGYTPATGNPIPGDTVEAAIQKVDGNNDNQDTLIGTSQGDTNLGVFPGDLITDNTTVKGALTELEDAAEGFPEIATGVTAPVVLDAVLVDDFRSCAWLVTAFDENSLTDAQSQIIHGINDGTASADASNVRDDVSSKIRVNGNFNFDVEIVLNGSGAAQEMRLQVDTTELLVTYTAVRLGCAPSGY